MIPITTESLNLISQLAAKSPRKRAMHNFHATPDDLLQRMLNAIEPGTYVCPHRHQNPDKREVFILIRGKLAVVSFNVEGLIDETYVLDRLKGVYGIEIPSGIWHTIIALEQETVVYELKDGPYIPLNDKDFAPWAPREGDEKAQTYLLNLINHLNLQS